MTRLQDLKIEEKEGTCLFEVRVVPRSSRNKIAGAEQGVLKVKVAAPPVEGEANEEFREFLADCLDIPKRNLSIVRGEASRRKRVKVTGLSAGEVRRRLIQNE